MSTAVPAALAVAMNEARADHLAGDLSGREAIDKIRAAVEAHFAAAARITAARDAQVVAITEGKVPRDPSTTSARAARNVQPRTGTQRGAVLAYLACSGGATDYELAQELAMNPSTVRPRRGELVETGYVTDSGRRREHQGSEWAVWVPTASGLEWAERHADCEDAA